MKSNLAWTLVLGAALSVAAPAPSSHSQDVQSRAAPAKIGFYMIARAEVNAGSVDVTGATNLPAGSVIAVAILTHTGQGGERLNHENTQIAVNQDGSFSTSLPARKGGVWKGNMVCVLSFHPGLQLEKIIRIVGERGERLGDPTINPEIEAYSGGHYLRAMIAVIGSNA